MLPPNLPSTPDPTVGDSDNRCKILHTNNNGDTLFLSESGAIGMECKGRRSVHTIARWIAYSWNDLTNTHARNFPQEAVAALGPGDDFVSVQGHPYEP